MVSYLLLLLCSLVAGKSKPHVLCANGDCNNIGPGDSKEDVKWLDDNLREFFANN